MPRGIPKAKELPKNKIIYPYDKGVVTIDSLLTVSTIDEIKVLPWDAYGTTRIYTGIKVIPPDGYRIEFEQAQHVVFQSPVRVHAYIAKGTSELILGLDNVSKHPRILHDKVLLAYGYLVPVVPFDTERVQKTKTDTVEHPKGVARF